MARMRALESLAERWRASADTLEGAFDDRGAALYRHLAAELQEAFPKFAKARVKAEVIQSPSTDDNGEVHWSFAAKVTIPIRCRVGALIEDLDYTLPIWLNVAALGALLL